MELVNENLVGNQACINAPDETAQDYLPKISKIERQSVQELLRGYNINIKFLSVGCVIDVGCKSIPFSSVEEGMKELIDYVNNPYEVTIKWEKIFKEGKK